MSSDEQHVLKTAVAALGQAAGVGVRVLRVKAKRGREGDAVVEIQAQRHRHRFGADVRTVDRFETPAMVKARDSRRPPLLVAPYITRQVAERCRQLHLPFIDTAGNAYLERPGLLIYVVGQPRPARTHQMRFRALSPAGMQVMFALLCDPDLVHAGYRQIAARAGVALGTVGPVVQDLEARRFLGAGRGRTRKLLEPKRAIDEWVAHYPSTLRRKLNPRRFEADPDRLRQMSLPQNAWWGGEPAAEKLTQYLKPAQFTIYTRDPITRLVTAGRMRAAAHGNVEILEKFWNFEIDSGVPNVAPPILAYADLMASNDSRNLEAARIIYEQRIEPAFRASQ